MHEYLWVPLFILLTFGIWSAWECAVRLPDLRLKIPVFILSATLSHLLITHFIDTVGAVITGLASILLAFFSHQQAISLYSEDGKVFLMLGGADFSFSLHGEIMVVAMWLGLVIADCALNRGVRLRRVAAGAVIFLILFAHSGRSRLSSECSE